MGSGVQEMEISVKLDKVGFTLNQGRTTGAEAVGSS